MNFYTDSQTERDLALYSTGRNDPSIFEYLDITYTKGGKAALAELFSSPSNNIETLSRRINVFKFMIDHQVEYTFDYLEMDFIEHYLTGGAPVLRNNPIDSIYNYLSEKISPTSNYYIISRGVSYFKNLLNNLFGILSHLDKEDTPSLLRELVDEVSVIMQYEEFEVIRHGKKRFPSCHLLNYSDFIIRKKHKHSTQKILTFCYLLDAFSAVTRTVKMKNLTFPEFVESRYPSVTIKGLYHPHLKNPIANDIRIGDNNGNLLFLSGPNAAGKSTLLKSIGVCMYLSHIGFPVPAVEMKTSVFNGIFTTINLPDNINQGYSHYLSEVKRVKEAVLTIKQRGRIFVIFDELFKGTNVKDAFDGTLMIISALSKIKNSAFFISTHLVEVGSALKKENRIIFKYLDSGVSGDNPVYTYKLCDGISSDRLGILIIKKEGIMNALQDIIDNEM